ncbi:UDP-N-acetylenolpyruvoylglucosamine reductase [Aspergillus terreus]|uniref:UDP-N-acetylmuramate dehydrogenase n=1 Tax=Aspergillus terreus TaxID=33178 RepID=A0A5M3YT32_ASPTE|nr:hypothetical protein ATETN484_0002019700 [Aspergillus terreus]GFF15053.1 UDP-N-acetylenolpyruvoylglucosamine reductase [Aspergillus terreus]
MPLHEHFDLRPYNSLKISCVARYFIPIQTIADVRALVQSPTFHASPHLVLGSGTNTLFATGTYNGFVLKNEITGIETVSHTDRHTILRIGGGVLWDELVEYCVDADLGGVENLAAIPGTTGAAPVQNIGAYGVEIASLLENVEAVDLVTGDTHVLSNRDCEFGYRDSVFKHARKDVLIASVTLKLTKAPYHRPNTTYGSIRNVLAAVGVAEPTIQCVAEAVRQIRARKLPDPKILANAGSFFKNPVVDTATSRCLTKLHPQMPLFPQSGRGSMTVPAAFLIQTCGWKGWTDGRLGVYYNHALILVHHGGASGKDVLELAQKISDSVWKRFAIRLQPEVNVVH